MQSQHLTIEHKLTMKFLAKVQTLPRLIIWCTNPKLNSEREIFLIKTVFIYYFTFFIKTKTQRGHKRRENFPSDLFNTENVNATRRAKALHETKLVIQKCCFA